MTEKIHVVSLPQLAQDKSIKVLNRNQIDKHRWDALVSAAEGPLYSTFDYLSFCGEWEAVVLEENQLYCFAVPIPYRHLAGIKYAYQSALACYFTVLSRRTDIERFELFRSAWLKYLRTYKYLAKYFFHDSSALSINDCKMRVGAGLLIDLTRSYNEISDCYFKHRKIKLRKAHRHNPKIDDVKNLELFIAHYARLTMPKIKALGYGHHAQVKQLWEHLSENNQVEIYFGSIDNKIVSGVLLGKAHSSLYYMASFSNEKGRTKNVMTLLVDHIIKKYARSNHRLLDFGNMAIEGIDDFKLSFGAERYPIYQIYRNDLPWYFKIPKSILNFCRISVS